jgi:hypothetical protein
MRISISRLAIVFWSLVLGAVLAACGGGGADVKSVVNTTTTGQQLIDLKKALDAGAITQEQYEKEKARILKGN